MGEQKLKKIKTKYKKRCLYTSATALSDEALDWASIGASVLDGASAIVLVSKVANGGVLVGESLTSCTSLPSFFVGLVILEIRRATLTSKTSSSPYSCSP